MIMKLNNQKELTIFKGQLSLVDLEKEMLKHEQVTCPVVHSFGPGLYIREVNIPKGTVAIGHHQKFEHLNVFLKGRVLMLDEDGSQIELTAPMMFTGPPGRKIGYILEDVVWLNIYPTNETNVETLEKTYLDKSEGWKENKRLQENIKRIVDIEDYKEALMEFNVTEELARAQSENEDDQIPMPFGSFKIGVFESTIEGKGVFATAEIKLGETIAPARLSGKRTPVGRYTNHSLQPNAEMRMINNDIYLVAIAKIEGCKGGQLGEEITTNYRQNRKLIGGL